MNIVNDPTDLDNGSFYHNITPDQIPREITLDPQPSVNSAYSAIPGIITQSKQKCSYCGSKSLRRAALCAFEGKLAWDCWQCGEFRQWGDKGLHPP